MEVCPWWGGFYERMVQTVKRPLRKILKRANVKYEELLTILNEIEAVVNCRPLCFLYSDDIEEAITPSHLISGRRLISEDATHGYCETNVKTVTNRLKHVRILIEHFQKRWMHEYLTELREFHRCENKLPAKQLKIGDIVLITDDKVPRNRWKLGKVEHLFRSKDGLVRACRLKIHCENRKNSYVNRPVNKLCYFEVSSHEN